MAEQIAPFSLTSPGYFGLNTQDSPIGLDDRFAVEATNCVIDKSGRIGSRKGWVKAHTANTDLGSANVVCIAELTENNGTATTLAAGNGFLFKLVGTTLTTLTYGGGGVAPVILDNNWQFVSLNGVGIFFQRGYDPLIYDPAVSTTTFRRLKERAGYVGTVPQANCAVSAYGRLWVADTSTDTQTISFSDLLAPHVWSTGTSGTLNIAAAWTQGSSNIVAIAAHNNQLIVFGTKQILIYTGANTPATITLSDTLTNIGAVGRDAIQNTGLDIVFLSSSGVTSIGRTIQEKSAPIGKWSRNVHTDIQAHITANRGEIKSVYCIDQAFYLLTFPTSKITYCFDTLIMLPDGSSRVTVWSGATSTSFAYTKDRKLFLGKPGYVGEYTGYLDNLLTYRMLFYTPFKDFGNPVQTSILKKITITFLGAIAQAVVFKWGFDFIGLQYFATVPISSNATVFEWGIAEWSLAEWQGDLVVSPTSAQGSGSGRVLQLGVEVEVNGNQVSVQKIDVTTKEGRY